MAQIVDLYREAYLFVDYDRIIETVKDHGVDIEEFYLYREKKRLEDLLGKENVFTMDSVDLFDANNYSNDLRSGKYNKLYLAGVIGDINLEQIHLAVAPFIRRIEIDTDLVYNEDKVRFLPIFAN